MNTLLKFACIYCGQRMECEPRLRGRQLLCPACQHRIAIPTTQVYQPAGSLLPTKDTWDTWVPMPIVEIPGFYYNQTASNAVLAGLA